MHARVLMCATTFATGAYDLTVTPFLVPYLRGSLPCHRFGNSFFVLVVMVISVGDRSGKSVVMVMFLFQDFEFE